MNRKVIFLNLVLLALAGWLFWMLRLKWIELHQHEHTILSFSPEVKQRLAPPAPIPMFRPMTAAEYNEIAQKTLFARDRNPNVIVVVPPAPPPPPPPVMPELPAYFGSMDLGDPVVMLKLPKGQQKRYHAGDKVGPFQLVSFSREKVVFDWDGKIVERKPEELKEKEGSAPPQEAVPNPPQQPGPGVSNPPVRVITPAANDAPKISEKIGADNGAGIRQCVAGDTTPVGTIIDGYKKVITTNMFGQTCMWQQVNP
jgi:hypothetical protein